MLANRCGGHPPFWVVLISWVGEGTAAGTPHRRVKIQAPPLFLAVLLWAEYLSLSLSSPTGESTLCCGVGAPS